LTNPAPASNANLIGAAFMCASMALFAVEDAIYKSVTQTLSAGVALTVFGASGLILFLLWAVYARERLWTPDYLRRSMLIRSCFEITGRLFFALALAFSSLSSTSAILQATPLVVTAGAALFMGEKVGWMRWSAMAVGFGGVLMVLRPTPASFDPLSLLAVIALIGFAGRDLATRASPPHMTNRQLGILGFAVLTLAGVIICLFESSPLRLPDQTEAFWLVLTGVIGVAAYSALTQAMRSGDVSVVAPFRYTRLLFALILAVVMFSERPDIWTLAGATLIVSSGIFTLLRSKKA
jgi:drug/metabolite transporter (DMT)-like permease